MADNAERFVHDRIRDALASPPTGARLYPNVRFTARTRSAGPAHDGEADLVVVHPENGLLVIEVKSGEPRRDAAGHWYLGPRRLDRSPFKQAEDAKHDLVHAIQEVPGWSVGDGPRAGHAVAFPGIDLASLPRGHDRLGPDERPELILDADALADAVTTRRALDGIWSWWIGDGSRGGPLDAREMALIDEFLAPTLELHRLLRHDVDDGQERLLIASRGQLLVLNQNRSRRRMEVIGPAGSGKSLVAVEKARRLARDGWRTLFVCFNQALATAVLREIETGSEAPDRRPTVTTFHRLAERIAGKAGLLEAKPTDPGTDWFDGLARLLEPGLKALPDERFDAIVVDEGQDFAPDWLLDLELLLQNPDDDILWVFHDPGQALYRDDHVADLGLDRLELFEDYRSPAPVCELAERFYRGPEPPQSMGGTGRAPVIVEAAAGAATVDTVRRELHRLLDLEGVRSWHVAVLSGRSASRSDVWRERRFGNVELWNGAIDDAGRSLGLPADAVPDEPPDAGIVLFESIRRFKGLERPVVILCELPDEDARLDQLLYTGFTRATTQLVVIAPPALCARLVGRAGGRTEAR